MSSVLAEQLRIKICSFVSDMESRVPEKRYAAYNSYVKIRFHNDAEVINIILDIIDTAREKEGKCLVRMLIEGVREEMMGKGKI